MWNLPIGSNSSMASMRLAPSGNISRRKPVAWRASGGPFWCNCWRMARSWSRCAFMPVCGVGGDQGGVDLPVLRVELAGFFGVLDGQRSLIELDGGRGGEQVGGGVVGVGLQSLLKICERLARAGSSGGQPGPGATRAAAGSRGVTERASGLRSRPPSPGTEGRGQGSRQGSSGARKGVGIPESQESL